MDFPPPEKIPGPVGVNNDGHNYSNLEVYHDGQNTYKEVVPRPYFASPTNEQQHHYYDAGQPQTPGLQSATTWGASAGAWATPPEVRRILGLKRRTFFITAWVVSFLIAVGIGLGAGLGATMRSRDGGDSEPAMTEPALTALPSSRATSIASPDSSGSRQTGASIPPTATTSTFLTSPTKPTISTTKPTTTTTISSSSSSTKPTTTRLSPSGPAAGPGRNGGRCVGEFGGDCICLDDGICVNRWKGQPYTGFEGNWPCPDESDNIMACVVAPCLGQTSPAQCLWREACSEVLVDQGSGSSAPICPGDGDFVCCAHSW